MLEGRSRNIIIKKMVDIQLRRLFISRLMWINAVQSQLVSILAFKVLFQIILYMSCCRGNAITIQLSIVISSIYTLPPP